jgi:ferredoxin
MYLIKRYEVNGGWKLKENKKAIIFYFTGTGNSLYVAKELAKSFKQADIFAIPQVVDKEEYNYEEYSKVGFVIPLYFMGIPKLVKDFIDKIYIPNAEYIFSVVTRAYTKGLVFTEINKNLRKKGKSLSFGKYISFPDSYIRWAEARNEDVQEKLFNNAEKQLYIINKEIMNEKRVIEKEGIILNTTSSVVNKFWLKTLPTKNKTFKSNNNCIQCGICIKVCPAKNIKLEDKVIRWDKKCKDCMACIQSCPKKAIYFNGKTKNRRRYKNPNISLEELLYW